MRFDPLGSDIYRGLEKEIAKRPEELATEDFAKGVPSGFHASFIDGLKSALSASKISPGLALQLAAKQTGAGTMEWGNQELCRLIEEVVKKDGTTTEEMVQAIELLEGVGKSAEVPEEFSMWDASETALNRPRSRALQVLIDIQTRAQGDKPIHETAGPISRDAAHRVVEAWPADSGIVSAVIAERYVNLWVMDRAWLESVGHRIFDSTSEECKRASWIAYICWNRPFAELIQPLDAVYTEGLHWTADLRADDGNRHGSAYLEGLGRHLTYIWYRNIGSDALREAIRSCPPKVAATIVHEFAAGLEATPANTSAEPVGRIGDLVDNFVSRLSAGDLDLDKLNAIARIAEKPEHFSPARRMTWLSVLLTRPGYMHTHADTVRAVLAAVSGAPEEASVAMSLLLPRTHFYAIKDELEAILRGMAFYVEAGTPAQKARIADMCDKMVRQGFQQFESLFYRLQPS